MGQLTCKLTKSIIPSQIHVALLFFLEILLRPMELPCRVCDRKIDLITDITTEKVQFILMLQIYLHSFARRKHSLIPGLRAKFGNKPMQSTFGFDLFRVLHAIHT